MAVSNKRSIAGRRKTVLSLVNRLTISHNSTCRYLKLNESKWRDKFMLARESSL